MVALQAVLFLLVVVAALTPAIGPVLWSSLVVSVAVVIAGAVGVVLAGRGLGAALTPLPIPNGEGLAASGLYRFARHPMYASLVVICVGVALGTGKLQSYAIALVLAVFFSVKARMEERFLLTAYPGYAEYASRVGRFSPWVGRLGADARRAGPGGSTSPGSSARPGSQGESP